MKDEGRPLSCPKVSVVVPCFNEEEVIAECFARLTQVLGLIGDAYGIIFVDDGSRDNTPWALRDLFAHDPNITVVFLSRNFGHQHAVTAGLTVARGDATVIIDA